jgi:hypothetical protein
MERRRSERQSVVFKAEIISENKSYAGVIKNLSEHGAYVETVPTKVVNDFIPGNFITVKFQLPTGETLTIQYEVMWLYSKKCLPGGLNLKQNSLGIEIKESSKKLNDFLKTL